MVPLLGPAYWTFALASALLVPLKLGIPRSITFGVLSLAALYALLGGPAVLFVLALTTALWLGMRVHGAWTILALAILFALYKLSMEPGGVGRTLPLLHHHAGLYPILAGVGFSYLFLRGWDLVVTVHQGKVPLLDPISLAGYLAPFHMLSAGPIGAYSEHVVMNLREDLSSGFDTLLVEVDGLVTGLFYKFVVAESIRTLAFGVAGPLISRGWFDTALLIVYVFFDFAGYSRIALAVGRLSGVPTPVNFRAPFAATSITEFWTRWHASLGAFVRRNLYLPVQLHLVRKAGLPRAHIVTLFSLVLSFGFVGLWHRFSLGFLLWGAGMGAFMALEKLVRDRALARHNWARGRTTRFVLRLVGPLYVFVTLTTSLQFVIAEILHP